MATAVNKRISGAASAAVIALAGTLALGACAPQPGPRDVGRYEVGQVSRIGYGTVVDVVPVRIEGSRTGLGALGGAAAGAATGVGIAGGRGESIAGGIIGALIGGFAGAAIERGVTQGNGYEYIIETEQGGTISVITGARGVAIRPGTPVRIIYGERVRVIPDYGDRGQYRDEDRYYNDRYDRRF